MKTVKFFTLGCKVNQYDTQSIREDFIRAGFRETCGIKPADAYVVNTCTVTQRADSESLGLIRKARKENPRAKVIITGCLVELDRQRIAKEKVDFIVKNKDKNKIRDFINRFYRLTGKPAHRQTGISGFKGHSRVFLKIQDGCNNSCSYCKVPLVRGRSKSKPLDAVINEAGQLVKNGFKEIVLCGICLGAYGRDLAPRLNLTDVIEALENIDGLFRLRLSSIEARDVTDELIKKISQSKKLCPHLHIPIQSGDDEILKKMNRCYRRKDYLGLIARLKKQVPGLAITTDVLVGFPGESEDNFNNTISLIKEILPLKAHIFPYSPRNYTPAGSFKGSLSHVVIKQRVLRLKDVAQDCSCAWRKQFMNKKMRVLIESRTKGNSCFWEGHTDNYLKVRVRSSRNLRNEIIFVKLNKIVEDYFLAVIVK